MGCFFFREDSPGCGNNKPSYQPPPPELTSRHHGGGRGPSAVSALLGSALDDAQEGTRHAAAVSAPSWGPLQQHGAELARFSPSPQRKATNLVRGLLSTVVFLPSAHPGGR